MVCVEVIFKVSTKNGADSLAASVPTSMWPHFDGVNRAGSIMESGINVDHKGVCGIEAEALSGTGGV
jgi:hypothetical protein